MLDYLRMDWFTFTVTGQQKINTFKILGNSHFNFFPCWNKFRFVKSEEEMTNANPTDTNANDNSLNKLLWLSRGNGKKTIIIIYKNRSVPFHKDKF